MNEIPLSQDTIIAPATPQGVGALAILRISGPEAIAICDSCFKAVKGKSLSTQKSHTVHLGHIKDGERLIDEVLVSIFKAPQSYTGEHIAEISCHGSPYIQQEIIQLFLRKGCRMATAGEFTLRAFLNKKMDLSQAEAVADLIASDSEAAHRIALQQMRGGFSSEIKTLRAELIHFASLIELELDFAEEDVEFADRATFKELLKKIRKAVERLIASFATGNVIKNGIPTAIVGKPNVGKSTLLNTLLNEERALVSEIAGTTRDTIEDELHINGIRFRFIDTAGIRDTEDVVERMGVQKTFEKIVQAQLVLFLFDVWEVQHSTDGIRELLTEVKKIKHKFPEKPVLIIGNKSDRLSDTALFDLQTQLTKHGFPMSDLLLLSAREQQGINTLKDRLHSFVNTGALQQNETIITNARHYHMLRHVLTEIAHIQEGLNNNLSGDLIAIDIRQALHYLGELTGEVTTDDLLGNIFEHFCIGK